MPTRVRVAHRIVEHIAIAIECLRVLRPHRAAELLLFFIAQGEPWAELVFLVQLRHKPRLAETDHQRLERNPIEPA